jgi:hypothetical protein
MEIIYQNILKKFYINKLFVIKTLNRVNISVQNVIQEQVANIGQIESLQVRLKRKNNNETAPAI